MLGALEPLGEDNLTPSACISSRHQEREPPLRALACARPWHDIPRVKNDSGTPVMAGLHAFQLHQVAVVWTEKHVVVQHIFKPFEILAHGDPVATRQMKGGVTALASFALDAVCITFSEGHVRSNCRHSKSRQCGSSSTTTAWSCQHGRKAEPKNGCPPATAAVFASGCFVYNPLYM